MNIIFTKPIGKSLTGSLKRHKTEKGGKYESQYESAGESYVPLAQKTDKMGTKPILSRGIQSI